MMYQDGATLVTGTRWILSSGHVGPVHGRVVLRKQLRTQYVLQGQQQLELEVSR